MILAESHGEHGELNMMFSLMALKRMIKKV
jgi:hypothetical protein